jgi:hypothetical protein
MALNSANITTDKTGIPFPIRIWLIPSNNKYIFIIVFIEEVVNLFYIHTHTHTHVVLLTSEELRVKSSVDTKI